MADPTGCLEMQFQSLSALESRSEIEAAFCLLRKRIKQEGEVFRDHLIGWQGGSVRCTAYWLATAGIWCVLEPFPPDEKGEQHRRYWNCFGLDNPAGQQMLPITVEINPPHHGVDRRVAGLFARDERDRIYFAHSGKVGGGRKDIGQNKFREWLGDHPWQEIGTEGGKPWRAVAAIGPIDDAAFSGRLAEYVRKVAEFKADVTRA